MEDFIVIKRHIQGNLKALESLGTAAYFFVTDIDPDELWKTYLASFPEGTNPIFRERTEHDCNCCKSFIRRYGSIVTVSPFDGAMVSIWDGYLNLPSPYLEVCIAMSKAVHNSKIRDIFINDTASLGTDITYENSDPSRPIIQWDHFFYRLTRSKDFVVRDDKDRNLKRGTARTRQDVLYRSLETISLASLDTVIDLIETDSIYRGAEHLKSVQAFRAVLEDYIEVRPENRYSWCWHHQQKLQALSLFKNSVIGTLVVDLCEGDLIEAAVKKFETKVAPTNYKRPKALITRRMIEDAQLTITELGFLDSLSRRYAVHEDITINNSTFADRTTWAFDTVFDELKANVDIKYETFKHAETTSIQDFIQRVIPTCTKLGLYLENKHESHLVSLIAPKNAAAPTMFKWNNNFSWVYNGDVADSIKDRVKAAGGQTAGDLRISLGWYNFDDLDLHVFEPHGTEIYFGNKGRRHPSSGMLDVDMNAGGRQSRNPVENIVYSRLAAMPIGKYEVHVHNYNKRESVDTGFEIEIEVNGEVHNFHFPDLPDGRTIKICTVHKKPNGTLELSATASSVPNTKEFWNISTNKFQPVTLFTVSPNYWDGQEIGNKHWFFFLKNCVQPGSARGFFNEYLREDLTKHRKVFEVLGSKMMTEPSTRQLSGLGFSSTKSDVLICEVFMQDERRVIKVQI